MRAGRFVTSVVLIAAGSALSVMAASAADIPAKVAPRLSPVAAPIVFDWTGFYLGAYAGVGVQRSHGKDPTGLTGPGDLDFIGQGFTGGGSAGYNYQILSNW